MTLYTALSAYECSERQKNKAGGPFLNLLLAACGGGGGGGGVAAALAILPQAPSSLPVLMVFI